MPGERAAVGMAPGRPPLRVRVGKAIQLGKAVGVILIHHVHLNLAEAARDRHLCRRRDFVPAEEQQLMCEQGLVQRADRQRIRRRCAYGNLDSFMQIVQECETKRANRKEKN